MMNENFKERLDSLKKEVERTSAWIDEALLYIDWIEQKLDDHRWPEDVRCSVSVYADSRLPDVNIYPPEDASAEYLSELRRTIMAVFGVRKMERQFSAVIGTFQWQGSEEIPELPGWRVDVCLRSANALSPQCRIVPYETTVTRYKSECGDETDDQKEVEE